MFVKLFIPLVCKLQIVKIELNISLGVYGISREMKEEQYSISLFRMTRYVQNQEGWIHSFDPQNVNFCIQYVTDCMIQRQLNRSEFKKQLRVSHDLGKPDKKPLPMAWISHRNLCFENLLLFINKCRFSDRPPIDIP